MSISKVASIDFADIVKVKTIESGSIYKIGGTAVATVGFTTEWTVAGDATARTVTLPLYNTGSFNATIDWGDSTSSLVTTYDDSDRIHEYASDGTYEVIITGACPAWSFTDQPNDDKVKLTDIIHWGTDDVFGGFSYLKEGFYGCSNLKSAGVGRIGKSGLLGVTTFTWLFLSCTTLDGVPQGLFDLHTENTSFNGVFYECNSLTGIPDDLFKFHRKVGYYGFNASFYNNTSLTAIPDDLFRNNPLVGDGGFWATFFGCSAIGTVPEGLFRYNTAVTGTHGFEATFQYCSKLQLNSWIFYSSSEEDTRFFASPSFENCFYRNSFTGSSGSAPALWDCSFGSGPPVSASCFGGSGNSTSSLDNYDDIPAGWL